MGYTILYSTFNSLLLIFYIRRYKSLDAGFIILAYYTFISFIAILAYNSLQTDFFFSQFNFTNVTLFPYLFLFTIVVMFISPTFGLTKQIAHKQITYNKTILIKLAYLYIIFALISIYIYYNLVANYWMSNDWANVRLDQYSGEAEVAYNNIFERLFLSFTHYFRLPALVIFFILLTDGEKKKNILFFILFFISLIFPSAGDAMRTASRGMILSIVLEFIVCYAIFQPKIPKQYKRVIYIVVIGSVSFLLLYTLLVTQSRFGDGDFLKSTLICYFGQPPIVFNSSIASIYDFYYGANFFFPFLKHLGFSPNLSPSAVGGDWGPTFYTFVGTLYMDFTPLGVIILAIIVPLFVKKFIDRRSYTVADLYLIIFYCSYLLKGALVIGRGFSYQILVVILTYHILKFITIKKIKI